MFSCGVVHHPPKNLACHHNSFSTIFVVEIRLWCCVWSVLQVAEKSAEAHLIVLLLEALNLVLIPCLAQCAYHHFITTVSGLR